MERVEIIDLTPENISNFGMCGYKDAVKHVELKNKIDWVKTYYTKGLRIKAAIAVKDGYQGMIEYLPGELAHRPVHALNYMFIHCIFVGFHKEYKGKGLATQLVNKCICDAKNSGKDGVAIITRKGSFMAKKELFLKMGFCLVEEAKPDFELMVLRWNENAAMPRLKNNVSQLKKYEHGLTVIRSVQCPYTEKNVQEILKTAKEIFHLETRLIDIQSEKEAQENPCMFGTFCIILNGEIISHSPISNTRFQNIMHSKLSK